MASIMKHAFLVSAHHQFEILGKMISLLDDENCDFYIHIDKKTKENPIEYELLNSPFLIARKFDLNIDSAIVDELFAELS